MIELGIDLGCLILFSGLIVVVTALYGVTAAMYWRWKHEKLRHTTCPKCGHVYYANIRFNILCACGAKYDAHEHKWVEDWRC